MTTLKRALALLLAALLLSVPASAKEPSFADSVEGQAFAVVLARYDHRQNSPEPLTDVLLAAEAAGWYAAWLWRAFGVDLVTRAELRDFQRSIGAEPGADIPPGWEESGDVMVLCGADGTEYLDFAGFKRRLDETLGQTAELRTEELPENTLRLTLRRHPVGGSVVDYPYELRFSPNTDGDSAFAWKLDAVSEPPAGPQLDPALTFDWDLLLEQNRLSMLLSLYDTIHVEFDDPYIRDLPNWILRREGCLLALAGDGETWTGGEYRGCSFVWETGSDGVRRVRVGSFDGDPAADALYEGYLTDRLRSIAALSLDRIEDGLIWADGVTEWDMPIKLAVDYASLALREIYYCDAEGEAWGRTRISYDEDAPDLRFLDAWDAPLKTVRLIREDWYTGVRHVSTETVELPADWAFFPWDGQWGDYTVYMDEGYTRPYAYPGDGVDYTLWLTTAKG